MMEDQVSECDSLEVIDIESEITEAVEEAADDEKALKKLSEVKTLSKPQEKIPSALTTSQYAQVIFHDILDSYSNASDVVCQYNITDGFVVANGDRIGLYRLPFLQPQEYIMFSWVPPVTEEGVQMVVFPAKDLPAEPDFYQFQYIKFDGTVAGASVPWHLNAAAPGRAEAGSPEAEDLVMVQTPLSSLRLNNEALVGKVRDIEEKYSSLLEVSEKLSEELSRKNASFVVLDARYKSLIEEKSQADQIQADIATLIGEKLVLEQSLHRANEGRHMAESEIQTLSEKIAEIQDVLAARNCELARCEEARDAAEQQAAQLRAELDQAEREMDQLRTERASINAMLDTELTRRESCLAENQHLLARLEDSTAMLQASQKSKEMAVQEIRGLVQTQDALRRELQVARDTIESLRLSKSSLEEEFVKTKDQLCELTSKTASSSVENQDPAVQEVLASLGSKLEAAEQTIRDREGQIKVLDTELKAAKEALDQQAEVEYITWQNGQLKDKVEDLTEQLERRSKLHEDELDILQEENTNLKQRLQAGAEEYKKLALERERPVSCNCQSYQARIRELTEEMRSLRAEMREGQAESRLSFTHLKETVVEQHQTSLASSTATETGSTYSGDSNMDSIRISSCMGTGARPRHPALARSTTISTSTSSAQQSGDFETVEGGRNRSNGGGSGGLPQPLQPENLDPFTKTTTAATANGVKENPSESNNKHGTSVCLVCKLAYCPKKIHICPGSPYDTNKADDKKTAEPMSQCYVCKKAFSPSTNHQCGGSERQEPTGAERSEGHEPLTNVNKPKDVEISREPVEPMCPVCHVMFEEGASQEAVTEHIEDHFGRECPFCFRVYENVEALQEHVQTHMKEYEPEAPTPLSGISRAFHSWGLGID